MEQPLTREQFKQIFEWAVGAAGMVFVIQHAQQPTNVNEFVTRAKTVEYAVDKMLENMPDVLKVIGMSLALETAKEVNKEEAIVADFMEEVNKFL